MAYLPLITLALFTAQAQDNLTTVLKRVEERYNTTKTLKSEFEQTMAKALLLTSLYMHFFTEHNKGHHKRVATKEDPSSARYGEPVYLFYFRTIIFSYFSAWQIAKNNVKLSHR